MYTLININLMLDNAIYNMLFDHYLDNVYTDQGWRVNGYYSIKKIQRP